jgi:hypothetical protein
VIDGIELDNLRAVDRNVVYQFKSVFLFERRRRSTSLYDLVSDAMRREAAIGNDHWYETCQRNKHNDEIEFFMHNLEEKYVSIFLHDHSTCFYLESKI